MLRPYALATILWAAVMCFAACTNATPAACLLFSQEDKVLHFLEYALFAFLLYQTFNHSSQLQTIRRAAVLTAVVAIAYGGALEFIQSFLPYRECNALDFMANCAGAAFTLGLCWRPRK